MKAEEANSLSLAFLGDAVYELYIRQMLLQRGLCKADALHRAAVRYVKAGSQAKAIKAMIDEGFLTDEETAVAKRARNHKIATKAKNADPVEYKWATALEALVGWLNLKNEAARTEEIITESIRIIEEKE